MKTKKEKLKQNNLSSKKTGLQIKIMKETKNKKRDWSRKKTRCKKTFLCNKNFISVAKKIS